MLNDQKRNIRDHYNSISGNFADRYKGLSGRYFHEVEEKSILALIKKGKECVLDIGTGPGRLVFSLRKKGVTKAVGIDIAERLINIAKKSEKDSIGKYFCVMDAEVTAFKKDTFETILGIGIFEYIKDLTGYLNEISRILKPGGEFIFTCWNKERWFGWKILDDRMQGSVEYSIKELKRILITTNFTIITHLSIFFIPTKIFSSICQRLISNPRVKIKYVEVTIALENILGRSIFKKRGGELIIKIRKI